MYTLPVAGGSGIVFFVIGVISAIVAFVAHRIPKLKRA